MKLAKILLCVALAIGPAAAGQAGALRQGDRYQLLMEYDNQSLDNQGVASSSSGRQAITVRLIEERDGGQELEYALPDSATEQDRLREWQLPARIFIASDGKATLLNPAELEARRDQFLTAAKLTSEACGKWIFTWAAFKIECDPQSALDIAENYRLQPPEPLTDGAPFHLRDVVGTGVLACRPADEGGRICSATLPIDPKKVRRGMAETDVVTGELNGQPITLTDALKAHEQVDVSGTIETLFAVDSDGLVTRRTTNIHVELREPGGRTETRISSSVLTRTKL